jgi:hypothetical protein
VRKAEVSIEQEMLHVSTKGILVCYAFIGVKFNGVLQCAGTVKIQGLDTFSRCISRASGYCVSYNSTLKLSGKRHSHGVYIC